MGVLLIVENDVALAERAAPGVLPAEPDRRPLAQQRPEGQGLGEGPIDLSVFELLVLPLDQPAELRVDVEAVGEVDERADDLVEHVARDRRIHILRRDGDGRLLGVHLDGRVVLLVRQLLRVLEGLLELGVEVVEHLLGGLRVHVAAAEEELGVLLPDRAVALDLAVHQRLRVARLVALVVAVLAVAHHVDDDVLVEHLPVVEREAGDADRRPRGRRR